MKLQFFASHDHLSRRLRISSSDSLGLICSTRSLMKKDEERDQKIQTTFKMTEKMSDIISLDLVISTSKGDYPKRLMTEQALILMKKATKVHQKIKRGQFASLQDGLRLTALETMILKNLMMEISQDLLSRNNRFFK